MFRFDQLKSQLQQIAKKNESKQNKIPKSKKKQEKLQLEEQKNKLIIQEFIQEAMNMGIILEVPNMKDYYLNNYYEDSKRVTNYKQFFIWWNQAILSVENFLLIQKVLNLEKLGLEYLNQFEQQIIYYIQSKKVQQIKQKYELEMSEIMSINENITENNENFNNQLQESLLVDISEVQDQDDESTNSNSIPLFQEINTNLSEEDIICPETDQYDNYRIPKNIQIKLISSR